MDTPDDLLIQRRRGVLQPTEARRLEAALRASSEYRLALLAGDAFDAEGGPAPGDAALVERLVQQTLDTWSKPLEAPRRRGRRSMALLAAAPVFVAAAAAASYGGYRAYEAIALHSAHVPAEPPPDAAQKRTPKKPVTVAGSDAPIGVAKPASLPRATPAAPNDTDERTAPPEPKVAPTSTLPSSKAQRNAKGSAIRPRAVSSTVAPTEPETTSLDATSLDATSDTATSDTATSDTATSDTATSDTATSDTTSTSDTATSDATSVAAAQAVPSSARAMFRRAQELRRHDWNAAAAAYETLIATHPTSHEAAIAEMALAKRALSVGRERDALFWFRAHEQRTHSPLAAEALWGRARALEALGREQDARNAWRRLLERHPESPYARIARARLGE